jgi:hypothetical protein
MSKTKLLTVITFLFVVFSNSFAQDKSIDSLKRELQSSKAHDTTKLLNIANFIDQTPSEDKRFQILNEMMGKMAAKNLKTADSQDLHIKYTKYLAAYYSNLA